jgi:hypothetical protein
MLVYVDVALLTQAKQYPIERDGPGGQRWHPQQQD